MYIKKVRGALAVAIGVVTALSLTMSAYAMPTITGEDILFHSNRDGDNEIYLLKPNGNVKQLTKNTNLQDELPAWRPQGDSFVYVSYIANTTAAQLYSMDMPNEHITQLTNDPSLVHSHPSYSPDGSRIVYLTRDAARQTCLATLEVPSLVKTVLLCADPALRQSLNEPVWSPDGTKIMYTLSAGRFDRYVFDLQTGTSTLLIPGAFTGVWSPDMSKVAYTRLPVLITDTEQVFIANADGTNEQQITNNDINTRSRAVAWFPHDSDRLLIIHQHAPDFFAEVHSLRISNLDEQVVPNVMGTADFADVGAIKP